MKRLLPGDNSQIFLPGIATLEDEFKFSQEL